MIKEIKFKDYDVKIYYRNQKNLVMTFKANYIRISAPLKTSNKDIIKFLEKYQNKIDEQMSKDIIPSLHLFGKKYELVFVDYKVKSPFFVDDKIVCYKVNATKIIREFYKKIIEQEINLMINDVMQEIRTYHIYDQINFKLSYIYAKTFLARCFYKKGLIEISGYLAKYPKEYYRYILIHEICHFLVPNHSSDFHNLVSLLVKDESKILKELKNYTRLFNYDYV